MTTTEFLSRFTIVDHTCRETFRAMVDGCASVLGRSDAVLASRFHVSSTTVRRWRLGRTWPGLLIRELTHAKIVSDVQARARVMRKMLS